MKSMYRTGSALFIAAIAFGACASDNAALAGSPRLTVSDAQPSRYGAIESIVTVRDDKTFEGDARRSLFGWRIDVTPTPMQRVIVRLDEGDTSHVLQANNRNLRVGHRVSVSNGRVYRY